MKRIIKNAPVSYDRSFNDNFYRKNPALMDEHTVPVIVRRLYTDVNGTIVDKAAVPASLQVSYPVFLFSQFDRSGGYKKSIQICPTQGDAKFLMTFTQGINSPFLAFTGANTIKGQIATGDICIVYTDDLEAPNWFVWIIISSESVSLASITENVESTQADNRIGQLYLRSINYYVSIRSQFDQPLTFTKFDNIGNYRSDSLQPSMFLTPFVEQQGFLTLETKFKIDQYFGITFYMTYACDQLALDFKVNKI